MAALLTTTSIRSARDPDRPGPDRPDHRAAAVAISVTDSSEVTSTATAMAVAGDVTSLESVTEMATAAARWSGLSGPGLSGSRAERIDVVVNNAAIYATVTRA